MSDPIDTIDNDFDLDNSVDAGVNAAEDRAQARKENISGLMNNPNTRPKVLATVIVLAVFIFGAVIYLSRGSSDQTPDSAHITAPRLHEDKVSINPNLDPQYAKLEAQSNADKAQEALDSGGSHLELPKAQATRDIQTQAPAPTVQPYYVQQQPMQSTTTAPDNTDYVNKMAEQFAKLAADWEPRGFTNVDVRADNNGGQVVQATSNTNQSVVAAAQVPEKVIAKTGQTFYAITENEANSDNPSPILLTIHSGPFKGAKAIANFTVGSDTIGATVRSISPKDGDTFKVDAMLVNPNTATVDLATDVNHHYFERYALLLSSSFISGLGQAAMRTNTVVSTSPLGSTSTYGEIDGKQQVLVAAGTAGQALSNELQKGAQVKTTVKIAANTPVAILILEDVKQAAKLP